MNKIQYFDIQHASNDKRNIKGLELDNKIKIILISDPEINISSCSVAIGAGYLHDTYQGTAHFLEHLLFMGSEKYREQNDYHSYIQINGGHDNAYTSDYLTCYYLSLETTFLKKGIEMLSWFFRAPILDESHIESEMEIINSEHEKNILMDNWIIDDIFKNFINNQSTSKYTKFGTGNNKSLKDIKRKDIIEFYNKYYTTDNIYVCIVDSKDINEMIYDYVNYFAEISPKFYNENDRFKKEEIEFNDNNLIIFKSSSEYLFINYYLITDCIEFDLIEYQLIFLINFLIGSEYNKSLAYFLKENNIIKELSSNIEYFYDNQVNLNIQFILNEKNINNFYQIYYSLIKYLDKLKNLTEDEFIIIYNNYKKIKLLKLLYNSNNDAVSISNDVVENMIKGNLKESVIRKNLIPNYEFTIWIKFLEMLKKIIIKITTNFNFNKINESNFEKSKWYNSLFYLTYINFNEIIKTLNLNNWNFEPANIIGISDFIIKNNLNSYEVDKSALPTLIYKNNLLKREIYLLEINKYDKPISNITIIRKNILLLNKENKIIMGIFIALCEKVLNYYLETMINYKLMFTINVTKEYIIYNFYGLNYIINNFVSNIIKLIHPETIFFNPNIEKYFNEIIRDSIESINNFKYNSPYIICTKYLSYLLEDFFLPREKLDFINKLTFDLFKIEVEKCLKYSYEYYFLIGISKFGYNFIEVSLQDEYNFENDNYLTSLIDMISINPKKYLDINIKYNDNNNINLVNYTLNADDINSKEVNNCLIRYWNILNLTFDSNANQIDTETIKEIIKYKIITNIIAELFNEPLFDKIRTIDKLGYIVKADSKSIIQKDKINFINNDFKQNYENYLEKFRLLKESKLIDLTKPFSDLSDEINTYIEAIISKIFDFNLNKLFYDVLLTIDFSNDIEPFILKLINSEIIFYDLILNKN